MIPMRAIYLNQMPSDEHAAGGLRPQPAHMDGSAFR
jgi:hypothetical protein